MCASYSEDIHAKTLHSASEMVDEDQATCEFLQQVSLWCRIQQQEDWTRVLPGFKSKEAVKESV